MGGGNNDIIPRPALRQVPSASLGDVCGQEEAVRAVRDLIELPMRHGHLFEAVGAHAQCESTRESPLPEHNVMMTTTGVIPNPNVLTSAPPLAITQTHFDLALREWLAEHPPTPRRPVQPRAPANA